ncbi:hypothetical protein Lal_00004607 [Lupinus albus]|nr:hypothetical protein Lal_00004607 [Lupinus albus]
MHHSNLRESFTAKTIRFAMLYGNECWAVKYQQENKLYVRVHTRQNRIRNKCTRKKVGVALVVEKMVKSRLRWYDMCGGDR